MMTTTTMVINNKYHDNDNYYDNWNDIDNNNNHSKFQTTGKCLWLALCKGAVKESNPSFHRLPNNK